MKCKHCDREVTRIDIKVPNTESTAHYYFHDHTGSIWCHPYTSDLKFTRAAVEGD